MKRTDLLLIFVLLFIGLLVFNSEVSGFFTGVFFDPGIDGFVETGDEICTEGGKPIVYFFGTSHCENTLWEKPIIEEVAAEFEGYISLHSNIDFFDNDSAVYASYTQGGVPLIIVGCKYIRNGAGKHIGEIAERKVLRNLFCEVSDSPICG